jgi:hypothetical protein
MIDSTIALQVLTSNDTKIESLGDCCFPSPLPHMGCGGAKFKLDSDQIVCQCVNFCLVPEVPFDLHGSGGLLEALRAISPSLLSILIRVTRFEVSPLPRKTTFIVQS